jgi:hypothetical protein
LVCPVATNSEAHTSVIIASHSTPSLPSAAQTGLYNGLEKMKAEKHVITSKSSSTLLVTNLPFSKFYIYPVIIKKKMHRVTEKVKLSLCLTKHCAKNTYGGMDA